MSFTLSFEIVVAVLSFLNHGEIVKAVRFVQKACSDETFEIGINAANQIAKAIYAQQIEYLSETRVRVTI
jgi:hypothetical protein